MNNKEKINQLRNIIYDSLTPLLSEKCILLDAPYYHNIGDVLLWQGEECFLNNAKIKCVYTASYQTCTFPDIDKNTTVIFHGGGNIGDLYPEHVKLLLKIVKKYQHNRVIVCPQTVFYRNRDNFINDFSTLRNHSDLYFCARDKSVYDLISTILPDKVLLLPDMAFCIDDTFFLGLKEDVVKNKLIIARHDIEQANIITSSANDDISDWPVIERRFSRSTFLNKIFTIVADLHIPFLSKMSNVVWNKHAPFFKNMMLKEGVKFISPYKTVETTRLHGCILSILLDKEIVLHDNSYGKNFNFYETWLKDIDTLTFKK